MFHVDFKYDKNNFNYFKTTLSGMHLQRLCQLFETW